MDLLSFLKAAAILILVFSVIALLSVKRHAGDE